jgi:hypothetical protein
MRKLILASVAVAAIFSATAANADYYRNRGGYHHGGRGGGWVAPLVGGMVLGGVLYGLSQPSYAAPPTYYPAPPAYRTECQIVPVYDRYGYYRGERRECYQVPNY